MSDLHVHSFSPHCRGHAQNGELAYGKTGKKSSANPDTVKALEGAECYQTACGNGHTLFLMKPGSSVVSSWGLLMLPSPQVEAFVCLA